MSVDPHLMIATGVLGAILLGAICMMADMALHPHCKECYHCRKKQADAEIVRKERRHKDYHYWDRVWPCHDPECVGRK